MARASTSPPPPGGSLDSSPCNWYNRSMTINYPISCAAAGREIFGVTGSTVTRIAKGADIGRVVGTVRLLYEADIEALRPLIRGKKGNPNGWAARNAARNATKSPPKKSRRKPKK
jgi:hypothetical protein